ncbi:hypothetical protein RJ641_031926 [Dillenia turbinata]|uniref:Uncharacterized protein n=1 Tax=Dillenia turbinata TaxID=194707 RepID=A0AAN8ZLB9_9MAGN
MGHGREAIEAAKTVLEVADVAWTAIEHRRHHAHHDHDVNEGNSVPLEQELESLRSENRRLRNILEENLKLLRKLSESPSLPKDCPPDLYARLLATVDSKSFLTRLESLQEASITGTGYNFPFKEATEADLHSAEILVNVDTEEPSWWVWVTEDMVPSNVEEWSGIDDEKYVVVCEEHVVDGVANFIARCILSNPRAQALAPEELQKSVAKALARMNKFETMLSIWHAGKTFYALSTWGLALAGYGL